MAASVDSPPLGGGAPQGAARPRRFGRYERRVADYARLMRLHRPIGIWLLMWPMLWALWIAAAGQPRDKVLIVFLLGVVVMRSAGCVVNDLADRNLDPFVRRTRERPLAARRISPYAALWLFAILIALALYLVTRLDALSVKLSFVGAGLAVSYPFFKRFFPLPQFYLGFAFGWAVPMAFAAQLGHVPRVGWVLFFITVLWAAIYDTIYAMADRLDDLKLGVKSSAILFADMDKLMVGAMQCLMLLALLLVGQGLRFGHRFYYGLAAAGAMFIYQQWLIRDRVPADCLRAFRNNNYVGMAVFIGVLLEYLVKH